MDAKLLQKMKEFRAPRRLQMEALTFLVSNMHKDIDFKAINE